MTTKRIFDAMRQVCELNEVDDWQPEHHDLLHVVCRDVFAPAIESERRRVEVAERGKRERAERRKAAAPSAFTEARGRAVALNRAGGRCEATDETGVRCPLRPVHVHHVAGRGGLDPHHPENLLALCHSHRDWVHANPEAARSLGLMRSRLAVES